MDALAASGTAGRRATAWSRSSSLASSDGVDPDMAPPPPGPARQGAWPATGIPAAGGGADEAARARVPVAEALRR